MQNLRALILIFSANLVSGFSQGITMVAIPWYIVSTLPGGQGLNTTMVGVITLISLFWGLYAGTLIDRYNRKRIFQLMNLTDGLFLLGIGLFGVLTGGLSFWLLAFIYGLTVFTYNLHYPNLYAFVQELFERHLYAKVTSAIELQGQSTNAIGMFLGGMLIAGNPSWWPEAYSFAGWTLQEIFVLDGITYLISFVLISFIPYAAAPNKRVDKGPIIERIVTGFRYLTQRSVLLSFGLISYLIFFTLLIIMQVVMPAYVNSHLEATADIFASFKGIYALGAIAAGILGLTLLKGGRNTARQVTALLVLCGSIYLVLFLTKSVWITLAVAMPIGLCNGGARILRLTYLIKVVPNHVIGRVNAFFTVMNVVLRVAFIALLAIPFFTAPGNEPHINYAFLMMGIILLGGALVLAGQRPLQTEPAELPQPTNKSSMSPKPTKEAVS
ncbi:MAG: MFS transporter [Bacteroidota bacterium]